MPKFLTSALLLALTVATPAFAADDSCPSDGERATLRHFSQRLANAGTTDEAKELALSKIELGHKAIDKAAKFLPDDGAGLAEAEARLDTLEAGVVAAESQAQVAAQFDRIGAVGGGCDYSTTEIVVIVIGFVLGIIPGIIFLFLFC